MPKQVVLHHFPGVPLPEDAKEIHFLLACSVIREQMYESGKIARQMTFFVTEDSVYAKMAANDLYYQVSLELVDEDDYKPCTDPKEC